MKILYLIISTGLLLSCKKEKNAISECIQTRINEAVNYQICTAGNSIEEYLFLNETVYVFNFQIV